MKKTIIGYIAGLLTFALLLGGAAYAESATKTIEVTDENIKIYVDDELIEMKDAKGNRLEAFLYNDSVYVPVRALTNHLAGTVSAWDGEERAVYLSSIWASFLTIEVE